MPLAFVRPYHLARHVPRPDACVRSLYVEEMYEAWKTDPNSVHKSWDVYFRHSDAGRDGAEAFAAPPRVLEVCLTKNPLVLASPVPLLPVFRILLYWGMADTIKVGSLACYAAPRSLGTTKTPSSPKSGLWPHPA